MCVCVCESERERAYTCKVCIELRRGKRRGKRRNSKETIDLMDRSCFIFVGWFAIYRQASKKDQLDNSRRERGGNQIYKNFGVLGKGGSASGRASERDYPFL